MRPELTCDNYVDQDSVHNDALVEAGRRAILVFFLWMKDLYEDDDQEDEDQKHDEQASVNDLDHVRDVVYVGRVLP